MAFFHPHKGAFVSVERAEEPAALPERSDWSYEEAQSDDYEGIKRESTLFKGWSAVDWEFVYSADGTRLHATDLRLFGDDVVYRVAFQAPDAVWSKLQPTLERIRDSFKVGGIMKPS